MNDNGNFQFSYQFNEMQSVLQLSIDINTIMIHEFIKYLNLMTEVFLYILNELSA